MQFISLELRVVERLLKDQKLRRNSNLRTKGAGSSAVRFTGHGNVATSEIPFGKFESRDVEFSGYEPRSRFTRAAVHAPLASQFRKCGRSHEHSAE
jgi:hypothetical protein